MKSAGIPFLNFLIVASMIFTQPSMALGSSPQARMYKKNAQLMVNHLLSKNLGMASLDEKKLEDLSYRFPVLVGSYYQLSRPSAQQIVKELKVVSDKNGEIAFYHRGKKELVISEINLDEATFLVNGMKLDLNKIKTFDVLREQIEKLQPKKQHAFLYDLFFPQAEAELTIAAVTAIVIASVVAINLARDVYNGVSSSWGYDACVDKVAEVIKSGFFVFSEKTKICKQELKEQGKLKKEPIKGSANSTDVAEAKEEIDVSSTVEGESVSTWKIQADDIARGYLKHYDKAKFDYIKDSVNNSLRGEGQEDQPGVLGEPYCKTVLSDFKTDLKAPASERAKELHARMKILKEQDAISSHDEVVEKCAEKKLKTIVESQERGEVDHSLPPTAKAAEGSS